MLKKNTMKITFDVESKELAVLVIELQEQPDYEKIAGNSAHNLRCKLLLSLHFLILLDSFDENFRSDYRCSPC